MTAPTLTAAPDRTQPGTPRVIWVPGPSDLLEAGLLFRVGMADEPLPSRGWTHLVEHLACTGTLTLPRTNGFTAATVTGFLTSGTPAEVQQWLDLITANLADLPTDRLDTEVEILRLEASNQPGTPIAREVAVSRHGAGPGARAAYPEWGLNGVTPATLQLWADQHCTAGNAVLWLAGGQEHPQPDITLPAGARSPPPSIAALPEARGAWETTGTGRIAMAAELPDEPAAEIYTRVLDLALKRELRQARALSYDSHATAHATGNTLELLAVTDAVATRGGQAKDTFLDVIDTLATAGPHPDDLRTAITTSNRELARQTPANQAAAQAWAHLMGQPANPAGPEQFHDVTAEAVTAIAATARATATYLTPDPVQRRGIRSLAELQAHQPLTTGRGFARHDGTEIIRLSGTRLGWASTQSQLTFDLARLPLVGSWPDGRRLLLDHRGWRLLIEPGQWRDGKAIIEAIDTHAPAPAICHFPTRDQAEIPRSSRWLRLRCAITRRTTGYALAGLTLLPLAGALAGHHEFNLIVLLLAGIAGYLIATPTPLAPRPWLTPKQRRRRAIRRARPWALLAAWIALMVIVRPGGNEVAGLMLLITALGGIGLLRQR